MTVTFEKSDRDTSGYRLSTELLVGEPVAQVFDFFADAFQLETITPPCLRFSVQTPPPIEMRAGTLIDYRLRLHGLPNRWRSKISEWEPPFHFVDEQVRGPYRYWHHLHAFEEIDGATLVRDIVHYDVRLDFVLHTLLVRRDLRRIFEFRRETMSRIFTPLPHSALLPKHSC
jgi:ligand-binding SRPBCC domain-containing protein